MRKIERPKGVKKFIKKLGLKWRVNFFVDEDADTFNILCLAEKKEHQIFADRRVLQSTAQDEVLYEWLHELCHAKLAEVIDPQFATMFFSKRYKPEQDNKLASRMQMLYYAWVHIDIWVNQLMRQISPKLAYQEREDFTRILLFVADTQNIEIRQILNEPRTIISIAINIAEKIKLKQKVEQELTVLKLYEPATQGLIYQLIEAYQKLPPLKYQKTDIVLLEKSVQAVAQIMELPFVPRLIKEKNKYVWLVD